MSTPKREKITDLTKLVKGGDKLPDWLVLWAEKKLGLHALNVAHAHIEDDWEAGSTDNFFKLACKHLSLNYDLTGLENIPKEGPCVIVSNHPHGMSDGLMFGDIAMKVRSDIRIVVNEFLQCVRGMVPYEIMVDVYGGEAAKRANMAGMREILRWLKGGHCILVFPSGSAATYSHKDRRVIDDPWQTNIASLIRKTGATVVPMHISGRTGIFFQILSIINKGVRANFLAREILRDGRMRHTIRLGKPISPATIAMTENDESLSDYLRLSSMLLRYPQTTAATTVPERSMA
ncbi:MAG: lysophospholipid acyltransferase family protein, partial [Akkermansia sp.]|nr:lysophospholipid acyltransferase family protein [Akkermansia sp.]